MSTSAMSELWITLQNRCKSMCMPGWVLTYLDCRCCSKRARTTLRSCRRLSISATSLGSDHSELYEFMSSAACNEVYYKAYEGHPGFTEDGWNVCALREPRAMESLRDVRKYRCHGADHSVQNLEHM